MRVLLVFILIALCANTTFGQIDVPEYLNATLPIDQRVADLMQRMTLKEKIGQMNQYLGRKALEKASQGSASQMLRDLEQGEIGSLLMVRDLEEGNELQRIAEKTRLKIPFLNAIDAIHGHCLYYGATVFPTCIGMASSWNVELIEV